jgi:hypothetical protein
MRLVSRYKTEKICLIVAFLLMFGMNVQAQTSKYISEAEYNTVSKKLLNPQNIQQLPFLNVHNVFLYNKSIKIWKGSLNGNLRFSLTNQVIKDEINYYDAAEYEIRFDPNELYYQKSFNNFTFGIGRKRIKWGVGYVSSPTDIVSNPPSPTDPSDRLFQIKGSDLFQASYIGSKSQYDIYIMPKSDVNNSYFKNHSAAFRYFTNIQPFDISLVGRIDLDGKYQAGFNQTVAIGEKLELHSDAILSSNNFVRYPPDFSTKKGIGYRLLAGTNWSPSQNYNIVVEYFHISEGYSENEWNLLQNQITQLNELRTIESTAPTANEALRTIYNANVFPLRKDFIFTRLVRNNLFKDFELEWITFACINDTGTLNRLGIYYKFQSRFNLYCHYQFLLNESDSSYNLYGFENTCRLGLKISL